jgi:hypothetical protein
MAKFRRAASKLLSFIQRRRPACPEPRPIHHLPTVGAQSQVCLAAALAQCQFRSVTPDLTIDAAAAAAAAAASAAAAAAAAASAAAAAAAAASANPGLR